MTFIVVKYCMVLDLQNKLKEALVMEQSCCTYENRPNIMRPAFLVSKNNLRLLWLCGNTSCQKKVLKTLKRAKLILTSIPFKVVCTFVLYLYCNWEQCKWFLSIKYKWKSSLKCNRLLNFVDIDQFYIYL